MIGGFPRASAPIPFAGRRVAIVTGRSDPRRTGLSSDQRSFLASVTPSGAEAFGVGYPWQDGAEPEGDVPLALAAWRNAGQWAAARTDGEFRSHARGRVDALRGASGALVVVTGSCGLDILAAGWSGRPGPSSTLVIALGPVRRDAPRLDGAQVRTVQGTRDRLSRLVHRGTVDERVPCGHLGYWGCARTIEVVRDLIADHLLVEADR